MSFERSEQINELSAALAKAQGEMPPALKAKVNPHYKSNYADITAVWDACRAPLAKNSLAVMQHPSFDGTIVSVRTILTHSSGQWVASELKLRPTKNDPQGVGSAITYAKRYALEGVLGVSKDDDDDGNEASQKPRQAPPPPPQGPKPPPAKAVNPPHLKKLFAVANALGFSDESLQHLSKKHCGVPSRKDLTPAMVDHLIAEMEQLKARKADLPPEPEQFGADTNPPYRH